MIMLRLAALVSAAVTVTLNAHHGFRSTSVFEYAVLFAVLYAALDVAKCTCLVGMGHALRNRHYGSATLLCLLFLPLFLNSLWCGIAQLAISRAADKGQDQHTIEARTRAQADYQRLTNELTTMQANPTFTATAACALPKSATAKEFCTAVARTKTARDAAATTLNRVAPTDPEPHLSLVAAITQWSIPSLKLSQSLALIVLAELVGSLGFALSRSAVANRVETPRNASRTWKLGRWRRASETAPEASPAASTPIPATTPATASAPKPFKLPVAKVASS